MSYLCVNPEVYHGERGNPPEFVRTAPIECSACFAELDRDDDTLYLVHRQPVCADCVLLCGCCGEWIDDTTIERDGPAVRYREWANDGKLVAGDHALCAAEYLAELFELPERSAAYARN